jgi:uncharacterized membrane protein
VKKDRLTENHSLWEVERFKEKRKELHNLIRRLSEQWKGVRSKTALVPLPNHSTPPAPEAAAKEDKDTPPPTPSKRKARSAEPMEVPDEDDEVIILDVPAAKRPKHQPSTPRKKTGGTPRRSTGGTALRFYKA